jgi:Flp pilus assembly pilin Flp
MKALMKRFWAQQERLELVAYAVVTALLVAALIAAFIALGAAISERLDAVRAIL